MDSAGGIRADLPATINHHPESPVLGFLDQPAGVSAGSDRRIAYSPVVHKPRVHHSSSSSASSGALDTLGQYTGPLPRLRAGSATAAFKMSATTGHGTNTHHSSRESSLSSIDSSSRTIVTTRSNVKSYHRPLRPRASTTGSIAARKPPETQTSWLSNPTDSVAEFPETGIIAIGMALGSPSHPPDMYSVGWQPQIRRTVTITAGKQQNRVEGVQPVKARKWGIFGRMRSKRTPDLDSNRRMSRTVTRSLSTMTTKEYQGQGNHWDDKSKASGHRKTTPKHTPIIIRSQTTPMISTWKEDEYEAKPPTPPKENFPRLGQRQTATVTKLSHSQSLTKSSPSFLTTPQIDVEIPSIKMDRYSVMFDSLLQQKSASSLLARRQANLEKLRAINEQYPRLKQARIDELKRPRRLDTSAALKNSPTFSLFPPSPTQALNAPAPSPRLRSNTSPAAFPSPLRATVYELEANPATPDTELGSSKIRTKSHSPSPEARQSFDQPKLVSRFSQKKSSPRLAGSTNSPTPHSQASPERHPEKQADSHIVFTSPNWQISSTPLPVATSKNRTATSPRNSHTQLPDAVEVSIARQISVSRDQRKMLGELRGAAPNTKPRADSAADKVLVGVNKRLAETKTATPRLVHPGWDPESPQRSYRKSSRVVLERA